MPNLKDLSTGVAGLFNRPVAPYGAPPQAPVQSLPPAPKLKTQAKPTEISMSDLKYNAFNVDQIKVSITDRRGFNGVTPDLIIWNQYRYDVTRLKATADETELTGFVNWALQSKGISDAKIDFHPEQRVTVSGKYPLLGLPVPFTAEIQMSVTPARQILLTVDGFKTGFSVPDKLRDTLLNLFISDTPPGQAPPPLNPLDAFSLGAALHKVGPNQILVDFSRMPVPVTLPITMLQTSEEGISVEGGQP